MGGLKQEEEEEEDDDDDEEDEDEGPTLAKRQKQASDGEVE